ncbi:hypothetical protein FACS1894177_07600 [Bacteroidia bacterium]|nr:hypothetical protein FACS1894177_07600 [Bacteroidia bacterium]
MEDCIGKKAVLDMYSMQPGDVKTTYADIGRLEKIANYRPHITVKEGIQKFVDWYKLNSHF